MPSMTFLPSRQSMQRWSIPALTALFGLLPAWWAFPQGVGFWRSWAILSGWLASGLLLASLLLMIREPRLAGLLGGLQRMYLWHHHAGVLAYLLLLTHPLALAADGWQHSPHRAWLAIAPWQGGATIATGWLALLLMMAGLALAFAHRIPYELWRRLHHLLSASTLAGAAHLLLLGLPQPLLWLPALAIGFLLWRFLRADRGLGARPYVVDRVARLSGTVMEVTLRPLGEALHPNGGQFLLAAFGEGIHYHGCREYHPFTVERTAANGAIVLAIKSLGDCTGALQDVEPGVAVRLQGPFGNFLDREPQGPGLWIAGGIGITPFLSVLQRRTLRYPVRLFYLYRSGADAPYLAELEALAGNCPLLHIECIETGADNPDLEALLPAPADLRGVECHICGPAPMAMSAAVHLRRRGVAPERIHFEQFDFR